MIRGRFFSYLLAACVSVGVAIGALGLAYARHAQAGFEYSIISGVARDGWIAKTAQLQAPRLAERGNRLILKFTPSRPAVPDSRLTVSVCGELRGEYLVGAGTEVVVPLRGACQPRTIQIQADSSFRASETDPRELSAQIEQMTVSSRLGVPIVAPEVILAAAALLFLLTIGVLECLSIQKALWSAALIPALAFYPLSRVDPETLMKPLWLWVTLMSVLLGYRIGQRLVTVRPTGLPASDEQSRAAWVILALLCATGAALRFHGITFGLPENFHPDEMTKVNTIMRMVANNTLDPNYFLHPSLLLYCTYALNTLFHLLGMQGEFRDTAFVAGRTVSAVAGTLSIPVLFLLGRRLCGTAGGLIAAALLAFFPLHITCSRYLKEDVLLTFFILLAAWLAVAAAQQGRKGLLFAAAACVGLASSTKYSGILSAGILVVTPWIRSQQWRPDWEFARWALAALLVVPIVTLAASPYIVLNYPKFISHFSYERKHALRGHTEAIDAWSQFWMYHLARSIVPGTSVITTIAALLGVGILAWRRRMEDLFIVGVLLAFYLPAEWVKSKPEPQPERYIFPCLPFIALAAASAVQSIKAAAPRYLALLCTVAVVAPPIWRSLALARDITSDTRIQASQWFSSHAPQGAKVLLEWKPYAPVLPADQFESSYIERENLLHRFSVAAIKGSGNDYLALSSLFYDRYFSQPGASQLIQNRYRAVFSRLPVVAEFNAPSGTYGFHNPRITVFSLAPDAISALEAEIQSKAEGKIDSTSNELRSDFFKEH